MAEINYIVVLYPKPGKAERVEELIRGQIEYVDKNEPGTLRYHLHKRINADTPEFVMIETFKDQQALDEHLKAEHLVEFRKKTEEEDLFAKPLYPLQVEPIGGFASR